MTVIEQIWNESRDKISEGVSQSERFVERLKDKNYSDIEIRKITNDLYNSIFFGKVNGKR